MMYKINDGGPAFPETGSRGQACGNEGMSLRDYFAANASEQDIRSVMVNRECLDFPEHRCRARYRHADAMLRAREAI